MNASHFRPVPRALAWRPDDFQSDRSWLHQVSRAQAAEIAAAAERWRRAGRGFEDIEAPGRQLPALAPLMAQVKRELATRGFVLLRGLPVQGFSEAECANICWAVGALLGQGVTQNGRGDLVCPVAYTGITFSYEGGRSTGRAYQSNARLAFHDDPADAVALFCVRKAKAGGASAIASAQSVYNAILEEHPEHLPILFRGFPYDRKGENWPEEPPVSRTVPVFARRGERVSCRYAHGYINDAAASLGRPLSAAENAALDCFDATAARPDLVLHMDFEPGDMQILNNYTVLHGRTAFEDHEEPDKRRLLWRLWLRFEDVPPWSEEDPIMRHELMRFGNLGWTLEEWRKVRAEREVA